MSIRALVGISVVFLSSLLAADFRPDTILSVLVTNDSVFASTRTGLFRANRSDKKWSAVILPEGVQPAGCFNSSSMIDAPRIYYSPPAFTEFLGAQCPVGGGLWSSSDAGKTWVQVDADHYFTSVFAHTDGNLYGVVASSVAPSNNPNIPVAIDPDTILSSSDGGRTWRVRLQSRGLISIHSCPANPAHICGMGGLLSASWLEYAPETGKWSGDRVDTDTTYLDRMTPSEYLAVATPTIRMSLSPSSEAYEQHTLILGATLENYFRYDFGTTRELPGVTLRTGANGYSFRQGESKVVKTSMELMPMDPIYFPFAEMSLPDVAGTTQCWALHYVLPSGKHGYTKSSCAAFDPSTVSATSHILIKSGTPYTRSIDLDSFMSLDAPGLYHLQLIFDDSRFSSANDWSGYFTGEPFDVTIVPSP